MFDPEFPNNNIMNTAIDVTPRVCFPIPTIQYTTLSNILILLNYKEQHWRPFHHAR